MHCVGSCQNSQVLAASCTLVPLGWATFWMLKHVNKILYTLCIILKFECSPYRIYKNKIAATYRAELMLIRCGDNTVSLPGIGNVLS